MNAPRAVCRSIRCDCVERLAVRVADDPPGDRDLHLQERVRRADRPVTAQTQDGAAADQVPDRIQARGARAHARLRHRLGHRIGLRPERLDVRDHAEPPQARDVGRIRQLQVRDVVPEVVHAVRAARGLDGVEGAPDRPVAERVLVHLEAQRVESRHRVAEFLRLDELDAAAVIPAEVALVRIEQRRGAALGTAIEHDLDRGRVDVAAAAPRAHLEQVLDLLRPSMPVPPQGRHDPRGETALVVHGSVRAEQVGLDPRVLPSGDPQRVERALGDLDRRHPIRQRVARHDAGPERIGRSLLQAPARGPVRVADDVPVPRVGRRGGDAAADQRFGVHPRGVRVRVHQEHGTVRHDGVEVLAARPPAGCEDGVVPPAADDPGQVRVLARERPDALEVRVLGVQIVEVHVAEVPAGERRVDVRVLEPRHDACAREHRGGAAHAFEDLALGADRHDPIPAHRDGACPTPRRVDGGDVADQNEIRAVRGRHGRGRYHRSRYDVDVTKRSPAR